MQWIKYEEQEKIVLGLERNFSHLIRDVNAGKLTSTGAMITANKLVTEINRLSKPSFFNEFFIQQLEGLAKAIEDYTTTHLLKKFHLAVVISNKQTIAA